MPRTSRPSHPYVGLVPYGEEDAAFFFGRDEEKRIVAGNLRASRLTLLYGASGVGKTSLLRAGVVHDLRTHELAEARPRDERAPFAVCVFSAWRDDPLPALMEAIRAAAVDGARRDGARAVAAGRRRRRDAARLDRAGAHAARRPRPVRGLLPLPPGRGRRGHLRGRVPRDRQRARTCSVHFLLSIREDALAKLDRFKGSIPRLFANYVRVEHLNRAAARHAIEGPVDEWNRRLPPQEPRYALEPALVEAVIDAAATGEPRARRSGTGAPCRPRRARRGAVPPARHGAALACDGRGGLPRADARAARRSSAAPQRIVENHLLEALGALTAARAGGRRRPLPLPRHPIEDEDRAPGARPRGVDGPSRAGGRAVLDKLCRGESGRILRRDPASADRRGRDALRALPRRPRRADRRVASRVRAGGAAPSGASAGSPRIGGVLVGARRGLRRARHLGAGAAKRGPAARRGRPPRSLSPRRRARSSTTTSRSRSSSGSRRSGRARAPKPTSAMVEALVVARQLGCGGDPARRTRTAFGPSRTAPTAARSPPPTSTARCGSGTRRPGSRSASRSSATRARSGASPSARTERRSRPPASTGPCGSGTSRTGARSARPSTPASARCRSVAFSSRRATRSPSAARTTPFACGTCGTGEEARPPLQRPPQLGLSRRLQPGRTNARIRRRRPRRAAVGPGRRRADADARSTATRARSSASRSARTDARSRRPTSRARSVCGTAGRRTLGRAAAERDGRGLERRLQPGRADARVVGLRRDGAVVGPRTGRVAADPLRGHAESVIGVAYARDGTLASASYDGTVRLWDRQSLRLLGEPLGAHHDRVTTVSISPDGRTLASGGFDRAVRLWDVVTERSLGQLGEGRIDSIESVAYSPDGSTLAAADVAGSIWLWEVPGGTPVGAAAGSRRRGAEHRVRPRREHPRVRRRGHDRAALGSRTRGGDRRAPRRARGVGLRASPSARTVSCSRRPARTTRSACGTSTRTALPDVSRSPTERRS